MGRGIWAMHFVGMLASEMGLPAAYDLQIARLSLVIPSMSHELRTPRSAIIGDAGLRLGEVEDGPSAADPTIDIKKIGGRRRPRPRW